jgi:hypothetical protein
MIPTVASEKDTILFLLMIAINKEPFALGLEDTPEDALAVV